GVSQLRKSLVPFGMMPMRTHSKGKPSLIPGVLVVALGCGSSDQPSQTLSATDVGNLPPGNAVGTSFSGGYILDNVMVAACDCRVGSCSKVHGNKGDTFTLTEKDGALNMVEHSNANDVVYNGGIDHDGKFLVGGSVVTDKSMAYSRISGTVMAATSIDAE